MDLYWVWLSNLKGIGPVTQKRLLYKFGNPYAVYNAPESEILSIKGIGQHSAEIIHKGRNLDNSKRILEKVKQENIKLLTYSDELYPEEIRSIEKAPILIYYKGNIKNDSLGIGIVGSRRCTEYGKRVTKEAAEQIAKNGIPVISGMAKGIDGYAHTSCLKAGGYTLAFLGNGLDVCYPREHEELMKSIIENGAILSQYPPGTKPVAVNFPERNLLISAWSRKLLVVEAGEKSGALITAEYAFKLGRKVYAVPNSIYSMESMGTNRLIENGACIYINPVSLLRGESPTIQIENYNEQKKEDKSCFIGAALTQLELRIIEIIHNEPVSIEEVVVVSESDRDEVLETLSMMELKGIVRIYPGGFVGK